MAAIVAGLVIAETAFSMFSSRKEGRALAKHARAEGERVAKIHLYNAELDRMNSDEAIRLGHLASRDLRRQGTRARGDHLARSGSSGASTDSASVQQFLEYQSRLEDEARVEALRNANTESTSFAGSAVTNRNQANEAWKAGQSGAILHRTQASNASTGALLSGAGKLASIDWG